MLDKIILCVILILILVVLWLCFCKLRMVCYQLENVLGAILGIKDDTVEYSYKLKEQKAEEDLAENNDQKENNGDLFLDNHGQLSYKAFAINKRIKEAKENGEEYIDDYEKLAVELERKNPYAR